MPASSPAGPPPVAEGGDHGPRAPPGPSDGMGSRRARIRPACEEDAVQYAESVVDLVGNTPLVRLTSVTRDAGPRRTAGAGQARVPQPRRVGEGPHRRPHGRRRRGERRAEARRHHRRADQRQHRHRAGPGRPAARLPVHLHLPRQGRSGEDQRAEGLRRRGRRLPDRRRPGRPALLLLGLRPAGPRDARRLEARPVLQPGQPAVALRDDRPGDLGADRGPDHRASSPAWAPAARSAASAGTSRRPPAAACASSAPTPRARSTPAAPAARTWSRASARTSGPRPTTARSPTRSSRSPTATPSR